MAKHPSGVHHGEVTGEDCRFAVDIGDLSGPVLCFLMRNVAGYLDQDPDTATDAATTLWAPLFVFFQHPPLGGKGNVKIVRSAEVHHASDARASMKRGMGARLRAATKWASGIRMD